MTDLPGRRRSHAAVSLGLLHSCTCTVPNFFTHTDTHTHTLVCLTPYTCMYTYVCTMHAYVGPGKKSPPKVGSCEISHY